MVWAVTDTVWCLRILFVMFLKKLIRIKVIKNVILYFMFRTFIKFVYLFKSFTGHLTVIFPHVNTKCPRQVSINLESLFCKG